MKTSARLFLSCTALLLSAHLEAQTFTHISSSEGNTWQQAKVRMQSSPRQTPLLDVTDAAAPITTFRAWGATFNELDWDALGLLTRNEQDEILHNVFAPDGDLRIARGRISMGANDYARSWYSCDEMEGDFELRYFNIDRDKQAIIPFVRAAQKYNPDLTCWVSPWCPPSWMKINGDYPVLSSPYNNLPEKMNYLLYGQTGGETDPDEMKLTGERNGKFPKKLATTDYMIQDPRYLQTYANMFCKFIDAYREQGIRIDMVMYQNEAYSYTPYPGCAWTAEGTIRFNRDYLAPTLKRLHPDVKLYLGTFNTNRQDYVEKILADPQLQSCISGMGFQWEGREILPEIRRQHPDWSYICSESECGWGSFDWKAAEHTFELMNHYLGNGCNEYIFWNFILADNGESPGAGNRMPDQGGQPDTHLHLYPRILCRETLQPFHRPGYTNHRLPSGLGRQHTGISGQNSRRKDGSRSRKLQRRSAHCQPETGQPLPEHRTGAALLQHPDGGALTPVPATVYRMGSDGRGGSIVGPSLLLLLSKTAVRRISYRRPPTSSPNVNLSNL